MVEKGSIVRVDFDAFTADGDLFDTTSKDVAKKNDAFNEKASYVPMPVVVGTGRVVPGFDKALLEANVGEEKEIEIPPEEAFGEKDAEKIETVSLREFQKQDVQPYPGMRVTYQQKQGTIASVTAGRVRIDFNPPLAGKTLKYKFVIRSVAEDTADKAKALVDLDYGMGRGEDFGVDVKDDGDVVELQLPDSCKYDQRWFVAKYRLVSDLRNYGGVKTVRFIEEYAQEEPAAEAAGEESPAAGEESASAGAEEAPAEESGSKPAQ